MPLRSPTADELRASLARLRLELEALRDGRIQPGLQNWTMREHTLTVAIGAVERQLGEAEAERETPG